LRVSVPLLSTPNPIRWSRGEVTSGTCLDLGQQYGKDYLEYMEKKTKLPSVSSSGTSEKRMPDSELPIYNSSSSKTSSSTSNPHPVGYSLHRRLSGMTTYQLDDEGHGSPRSVERFQRDDSELSGNPTISRDVGRFSFTSKPPGQSNSTCWFNLPATAYSLVDRSRRTSIAAKSPEPRLGPSMWKCGVPDPCRR
jgi:hypothetical protein